MLLQVNSSIQETTFSFPPDKHGHYIVSSTSEVIIKESFFGRTVNLDNFIFIREMCENNKDFFARNNRVSMPSKTQLTFITQIC